MRQRITINDVEIKKEIHEIGNTVETITDNVIHATGLGDNVEKITDNIINTTEEIACDVVDLAVPVVEIVNAVSPMLEVAANLLLKSTPEDKPIITKRTISIVEPEPTPIVPIPEVNEEIKTIDLDEPIRPYEHCVLTIAPEKGEPIEHIICCNLIVSNPDVKLTHSIVSNDDKRTFSLFIHNNDNIEVFIKICYCVRF